MKQLLMPVFVLGFSTTNLAALAAENDPVQIDATENLFQCDDFSFLLTHCSLVKKILATAPNFEGERYEADYTITYSFPCIGQQPSAHVTTESASQVLRVGTQDEIATVRGRNAPQLNDPTPNLTRSLSFAPGCKLTISAVASRPSTDTLGQWVNEAKQQARIITQASALYLLASDFELYTHWDDSRTRDLLAAVKDKIIAFDALCNTSANDACTAALHFKAIRNALQAKLDQAPVLPTAADLGEASLSLNEYYLKQLKEDVSRGEFMTRRFLQFQQQTETSLAVALARVPEMP